MSIEPRKLFPTLLTHLAAQDGAVLVILCKIKLAAGKMGSGLGSAGFL